MVKLRLKRIGKKHYPVYKIVAADSRFPRDGRFIEALGTYNPNIDPMEVTIKEPRILYWLKVGAKPTDTVRNLLKYEGVMLRFHLEKKGNPSDIVESEIQKFLTEKDAKIVRAREKKSRRKASQKLKKAESSEKADTGTAEVKKPEETA